MIGRRGARSSRSTTRNDEDGSAVVEFALVLPIVLIVLLAVVQVGALARDRLLLAQAARAGAREAAVESSDEEVEATARRAAVGLDPASLSVAVTRDDGRGAAVTVTLAYDAGIAAVLAGWLFPTSVELTADATTRQEFGDEG
jgi:Flp pilus assembly protein TadG